MNYYEEFGLDPSASLAEIRHAHKKLVRLIHPDRLRDEELREMAESQMKRVNGVFDVLSDPDRRSQYDLSLAAEPMTRTTYNPEPKTGVDWRVWVQAKLKWGNIVWVGAAMLCCLALFSALGNQVLCLLVFHNEHSPGVFACGSGKGITS